MIPISNRIVAIPGKPQPLESGLILPENSTELREGEVLFVGPKTLTVKVGDKVLYKHGIGTFLKYNDQDVFICDEGEIKAITT